MTTLRTKGGNTVTVSDETAEQLMREAPGAYVIVPEKRSQKMGVAHENKMAEAVENK